jgi:hypothetical protein
MSRFMFYVFFKKFNRYFFHRKGTGYTLSPSLPAFRFLLLNAVNGIAGELLEVFLYSGGQ